MGRTPAAVPEITCDKPLRDFLRESHARQMWGQRVAGVGMLECYVASGRLFIVLLFQDHVGSPVIGWDVFIPTDTTDRIDATLEALRVYIAGAAS